MTKGEKFLQELTMEAVVTRRYLARVPFEKADFKPAEKSETLGRLAIHVAEIIAWWSACINEKELNFIDFEPQKIDNTKDLLAYFDELLVAAKQDLRTATDEVFEQDWSMTYGTEILFTLPKEQVARVFCMNHLIHHRAQLGVYLRMLDIPLPAVYGPSADDEEVLLIQPFQYS